MIWILSFLGSPSIQINAEAAAMDVGAEETGGAAERIHALVADAMEEDAVRVDPIEADAIEADASKEDSVQLGVAQVAVDGASERDLIELHTIENDQDNDVIEIAQVALAGDNAIETDFIELCTIESDEENDVIEIYRAPAASKVVVGCVERVNVIEIDLT